VFCYPGPRRADLCAYVSSVQGNGVVVDVFEVVLEELEEAPRVEASKRRA